MIINLLPEMCMYPEMRVVNVILFILSTTVITATTIHAIVIYKWSLQYTCKSLAHILHTCVSCTIKCRTSCKNSVWQRYNFVNLTGLYYFSVNINILHCTESPRLTHYVTCKIQYI